MDLLYTMLVPMMIASVALYGMLRGVNVYDALIQGGREGLGVLIRIVPALIGLMTAVYMLRASGALELAAGLLEPVLRPLGIPPETAALLLVRPISGSGALGVGAGLIETYGPDSLVGRTAAVMLCRLSASMATGFSMKMCLPARAAWMVSSAWRSFGVHNEMMSTRSSSRSRAKSVWISAWMPNSASLRSALSRRRLPIATSRQDGFFR